MNAQPLDLSAYKAQKPAPCPWCDQRRRRKAHQKSAMAYIGRRCRQWLCVCPVHGVVRRKEW